jgi:predicted phage terminase large subunit-like protein
VAFDLSDVDSWTPADVDAVDASLDMLLWYEDFSAFAKAFWKTADSTKVVWSWHMDTLCKEAQALFMTSMQRRRQYDAIVTECGADHALRDQRITDEIDATPLRLVLLVPPRGSKTTLIARLFVVWCWLYHPLEIATFCAMEHNLKILGPAIYRIIRSQQYQALVAYLIQTGLMKAPVSCRRGTGAMMNLNLEHGGRWIGFVIEGNWTGQNVDVALIDDPHDVNEAMGKLRSTESKANAVAKVEDVYTNKIGDRFNNHIYGLTILIMQRVHLNDLAAVMIREGARVVTIPAEVDDLEAFQRVKHPDDPRTEVGQSYNPSRLPPAVMRRRREEDPFGYATKYLMVPTLQEGSKIQRAWFKQISETGRELVDACEEIAISVDSASSTNKRSDYTSMGVWGRIGARRVLLDRKFGKWGFLALVEEFKALVKKWPEAMFKCIENKASGIQLIEVAEKAGIFGIIPVNPTEAKRDRLLYATSVLEAGNVYLAAPDVDKVTGKPGPDWRPEYINNMVGIDAGGLHDDDGDMTSQIMERWARGMAPWLSDSLRTSIARPTLSTAISDMVRRWETKRGVEVRINREHQRQTTDIAPGFAMGLVPGWCAGPANSAGTAIIVDHRGVMVAMVVASEGGLANFATVVGEEASYWGVTLTRYAELPGMPAIQTVSALHRAGVNVAAMPPVPGKPYKWAGQAGGGYSGKPDAAAVLWAGFLDAAGRGMVQIRDRSTLTLIETLQEAKGAPVMPNGSPVTGAPLALLLAITAASALRESMKPRMAQAGIDLERLAAGA